MKKQTYSTRDPQMGRSLSSTQIAAATGSRCRGGERWQGGSGGERGAEELAASSGGEEEPRSSSPWPAGSSSPGRAYLGCLGLWWSPWQRGGETGGSVGAPRDDNDEQAELRRGGVLLRGGEVHATCCIGGGEAKGAGAVPSSAVGRQAQGSVCCWRS